MISVVSFSPNGINGGSKAKFFDGSHESFPLPVTRKPCDILFPRSTMISVITSKKYFFPICSEKLGKKTKGDCEFPSLYNTKDT